jgi:hypothetical protein
MRKGYDMAQDFHGDFKVISNGKIEELGEGEHHQHQDAFADHADSTSIFHESREVEHLNEYLEHFWGEAALHSYEDKIARIQQFNETEIPEFIGWIDRHYPFAKQENRDNEYENDNGNYGQLEFPLRYNKSN